MKNQDNYNKRKYDYSTGQDHFNQPYTQQSYQRPPVKNESEYMSDYDLGSFSAVPDVQQLKALSKEHDKPATIDLNSFEGLDNFFKTNYIKANSSEGLSKDNIKKIQSFLDSKGYYIGQDKVRNNGIDGILGMRTNEAIQKYNNDILRNKNADKFQLRNNRKWLKEVDGNKFVNEDVSNLSSYEVKEMQRYLNDQKDAKKIKVDGIAGKETIEAIESFNKNSLKKNSLKKNSLNKVDEINDETQLEESKQNIINDSIDDSIDWKTHIIGGSAVGLLGSSLFLADKYKLFDKIGNKKSNISTKNNTGKAQNAKVKQGSYISERLKRNSKHGRMATRMAGGAVKSVFPLLNVVGTALDLIQDYKDTKNMTPEQIKIKEKQRLWQLQNPGKPLPYYLQYY